MIALWNGTKVAKLFMTYPPTEDRVGRLMAMECQLMVTHGGGRDD